MYYDETNNYFDISDNYEIEFDKYLDKTKYNDTDISIGNLIFNRHNAAFTSPVEGFNRGNLFENLYSKYKNHVYKLKVNNKKDELLYKIQIYNFAIKDLNLYLDLHPTEIKALNLYHEYEKELTRLKDEYQNKYNPLCVNDVSSTNKWTWINNPWPWDKGGSY